MPEGKNTAIAGFIAVVIAFMTVADQTRAKQTRLALQNSIIPNDAVSSPNHEENPLFGRELAESAANGEAQEDYHISLASG